MSNQLILENLDLSELHILLGHLKLGKSHLTNLLGKQDFKKLLESGNVSLEAKMKISTNAAEKTGNVALVLNTVITSVFGAWMGFYGFMEKKLHSYHMLIIITGIAIIAGLIISGINVKLTANKGKDAIAEKKIYNLQINIVKIIIARLKNDFEQHANFLNNALKYFAKATHSSDKFEPITFEKIEDFYQWGTLVKNTVELNQKNRNTSKIYTFYNNKLSQLLEEIIHILDINFSDASLFRPTTKKFEIVEANPNNFSKILTVHKEHFVSLESEKNWLKISYLDLIAGILPVLLGGFASMFVFLTGGPDLANEFGVTWLATLLKTPLAKAIEFTGALGLTSYYGWAYFYNSYRNHTRKRELAKSRRKRALLEKKQIFLNDRLVTLAKLKQKAQNIIDIYTAIRTIEESNKEISEPSNL
jgi:hypothetical protein